MSEKRRTASKILQDLSETRRARIQPPAILASGPWEEVNTTHYGYRVIESDRVQASAALAFDNACDFVDIFLSFMTSQLRYNTEQIINLSSSEADLTWNKTGCCQIFCRKVSSSLKCSWERN
jgi:hypothetical protein